MDTGKVTHQYRLAEWAPIIRECKNSDLTVRAWCQENRINEKRFYYWQRKVREELIDMASKDSDALTTPSFAPLIQTKLLPEPERHSFQPDMVLRTNELRLEISNNASPLLLAEVIKVLSHA